MATPNEKLAASLAALRDLQKGGRRVFQSRELSRVHRERLLLNGFFQEVMKGWLIWSGPGGQRFGDEWHLSPEQSILLHAENNVVPSQAIVHSPRGTNNKVTLPFGTSLYDLKQPRMPPAADLTSHEEAHHLPNCRSPGRRLHRLLAGPPDHRDDR